MTTQAHHVGARDMTPEQVGMLNGRAAALQAATADLLERGYLRQTAYGRLEAWTIPPADVTPLQRAVVDAVRCRAPRLENVPAVRAALDELQRDAVRRGLLNPPRRGGKGEALKMTFMTLFGVAMAIIAATGKSMGGVLVGLGFTCFGAYNLVRAVRTTRQGRRTQAGLRPWSRYGCACRALRRGSRSHRCAAGSATPSACTGRGRCSSRSRPPRPWDGG